MSVLIFSFLLLLAAASGETEESSNLRIQHKKLFKSIPEKILGSLDSIKTSEPAVKEITEWSSDSGILLAFLANRASTRVTIEGSNLPPLTQVAIADCLKQAYEYQDTDAGRMKLFVELVADVVPSYQWNAVVEYQHLLYTANYYIKLRTDSGDVVFAFSSNK